MKIPMLVKKARELEARVTANEYAATERDVAQARELVSQYIDELQRLEATAKPAPQTTDIEAIADDILERWYP